MSAEAEDAGSKVGIMQRVVILWSLVFQANYRFRVLVWNKSHMPKCFNKLSLHSLISWTCPFKVFSSGQGMNV